MNEKLFNSQNKPEESILGSILISCTVEPGSNPFVVIFLIDQQM